MVPRDRGTIVQVGSALAYQGIPLQSAYCGAKHAIRGFTESVRAELFHEHKDVHVIEVHLPAVNTPQFEWCRTHLPRHPQPVPPIYQPEVPGAAIVRAAHGTRQEVLVGAPTVKTVLGSRLAPWLMTKLTAERAWEQQMTEEQIAQAVRTICSRRSRATPVHTGRSTTEHVWAASRHGPRSAPVLALAVAARRASASASTA